MLPEVTAIFPSITMASWASIFTGKLPNETGIPGNEFFARDLITYNPFTQKYEWNSSIPAMDKNPAGMVTLSEGAFPRTKRQHQALIPLSKKWQDSPQNRLLMVNTLYEELSKNNNFRKYFEDRGGKSNVVVFQHYARGADLWETLDLEDIFRFIPPPAYVFDAVAFGFDEIPGDKAENWLRDNLLSQEDMSRNDIAFPGVFVIYFAGLDHEAHDAGMGKYREFFKDITDDEIKDIVNWLKTYGEFDNKIFIIVSDHGMTAMPTGMKYRHVYEVLPDSGIISEEERPAEMSCDLKLDFLVDPENPEEGRNKQRAEQANNNLHIWELAEVLKLMPTGEVSSDGKKIYYKVLAPKEIVKANKGETTSNDPRLSDIIAAFNGPMAHIYVKGVNDWRGDPQYNLLVKVADLLQAALSEGDGPVPSLALSVEAILIRVTRGSEYMVYNGASSNAEGQITMNEPIPIAGYFSDERKYPNAITRIPKMNNPNRSGDIVIIFKDHTDDELINRYTSGTACKAWHGSLNLSDSYVPLMLAYPGGSKYEIEPIINENTLCPQGACDGNWKVKESILEIINQQYLPIKENSR